ncbi:hypothetical protein RY831_14710 [Noviherbaspirillum sp. CPCC 100848]|uniref:Uncharacterized protein n=1 Tax=Noviherbaspirillum album TaxID=3080276 RepID=A0ABU6JAE0_9BURK|nr:hypothetical protein [Noviherbaspirillum sp. CPCC 100848]MEC4720411.1 hypothetical protein [Noviherbaspirillum sp. CPCC 100848]
MDDLDGFHKGRVIGFYLDRPIYDYVLILGQRYEYRGLATQVDRKKENMGLSSNEAYLDPGLLYTKDI